MLPFTGCASHSATVSRSTTQYAAHWPSSKNDYSYRSYDSRIVERNASVSLDDIRLANRIGARMSAAESDALYARRDEFNGALVRIPPDSSLCDPDDVIPWDALHDVYGAADGVSGIGLAKLTKFLHKKRPELVPLLDSVVEGYLRSVGEIPLRRLGFGTVGDRPYAELQGRS